jgi:pyruvate/2-oxoglutarate dehydrogenase complex dihydrolipoamide acyltransferase (E2) component
MILEMKVPSPGESITEVEIAQWLVADGDYVEKDQAVAEVDSDKATLELPAEVSGTITLKAEEGDAIAVGAVVCLIDTEGKAPEGGITPGVSNINIEEVSFNFCIPFVKPACAPVFAEDFPIKRLIKERLGFKSQVKVFSSLVSKTDSLAAIEKQLKKAKANHQIIPMDLGNKKSRIVVWWFDSSL